MKHNNSSVPFNQDSGTQNKIKFKIDDVVGNTGYSSGYMVKIVATDPPTPVISSTIPDAGVDTTENERFKFDEYACACD